MKHLRIFKNIDEYKSAELIYPSVNYISDKDSIFFEEYPYIKTKFIFEEGTSDFKFCNNINDFKSITINGEKYEKQIQETAVTPNGFVPKDVGIIDSSLSGVISYEPTYDMCVSNLIGATITLDEELPMDETILEYCFGIILSMPVSETERAYMAYILPFTNINTNTIQPIDRKTFTMNFDITGMGATNATVVLFDKSKLSDGDMFWADTEQTSGLFLEGSISKLIGCTIKNDSYDVIPNITESGVYTIEFMPSSDTIFESAFQYCYGLTSITIPNSVTRIGDWAFNRCSGLTSITIPNSVTSIGESAFFECTGLTSVTIPKSVTRIGHLAFYNCSGLTSVTIPESVTSIGERAFNNCSGLTSITIPESVTSIGSQAFSGCSKLTEIVVKEGNTVYDSLENCNAIIETATNKLIVGCVNTIIPNSVTSIGDYAFDGCDGLTSITIPNSVTRIGDHAFNECSGLTSVTIGNGVTSIGQGAFHSCTGLNEIISLATICPSISSNTFGNCKSNGILKCPSGSDYSSWLATSAYYLGYYNWTSVEI